MPVAFDINMCQRGQQLVAEMEQGPDSPFFLQHLCGAWLLGAGALVAKQQEPLGLKPIS